MQKAQREWFYNVPILMLTARRQVDDKVTGLRAGADDYLTKPFQMTELLARIDVLLRRANAPTRTKTKNSYNFEGIDIDLPRMEVLRRGRPISASPKEFQLLCYFAAHVGETLSRDEILREVWGKTTISCRTVDVHVAWLRQKLEDDSENPKFILTVARFGYKFVAPGKTRS